MFHSFGPSCSLDLAALHPVIRTLPILTTFSINLHDDLLTNKLVDMDATTRALRRCFLEFVLCRLNDELLFGSKKHTLFELAPRDTLWQQRIEGRAQTDDFSFFRFRDNLPEIQKRRVNCQGALLDFRLATH